MGTNAFYFNAEKPWWTTIAFTSYQGSENGLTQGLLKAEQLWGFGDQMGAEVIGEDVAKKFFLTKCENLGIDIPDAPDLWPNIECYYIHGDREELKARVMQWLIVVRSDQWGVGGDDDFYDYYPDNFFVADQLCPLLGLDSFLADVRAYVQKGRYKGEEEVLAR